MKRKQETGQRLLIREIKSPKEAFRDIRNYLAGQFVGATRDDVLLDEVLKCLFCKLYVEIGAADPIGEDATSFDRAKHVRSVFAKVRADFPDIYEPNTEILLDPDGVCTVLDECSFSLVDSHSDPIGDAFEVFVGSESRGRSGQFFTPRSVTDLLVQAVDPQPGELIVDPACGAGGFLTSVVRHFLETGTKVTELPTLVRKTLYGIDKDDYLVKLARLHVSLLSDGHPNLKCADSLAMDGELTAVLPTDGFDVLFTNPPFGVHIVAAKAEVLRTFSLAKKWIVDKSDGRLAPSTQYQSNVPPQVLFVERCLSLLRDGGRMGIVLPESVLSNKSYRYVVEFIVASADVEAVIGMPDALFKTSGKGGTHTKTCLLVAKKRSAKTARSKREVFMAEAKWCGHDSRARAIPYNDLPTIAANYAAFSKRRPFKSSALGFTVPRESVATVLCPRYYDPDLEAELQGLSETHSLLVFGDLVKAGVLTMSTGDELGKLAYGTGEIPFIRTSDMSNWELKADPKHGISEEIYASLKRKQDVRENDLLMVKDGTYLIGTCALVTAVDTRIVYQSHIYKIRVEENSLGLDPWLLMALLSAPIVQRQVRSKQFTQDIIDSLGERIHELVLPVPRSAEIRSAIGDMVKSAIQHRIEARDLSKRARQMVAGNGSQTAS